MDILNATGFSRTLELQTAYDKVQYGEKRKTTSTNDGNPVDLGGRLRLYSPSQPSLCMAKEIETDASKTEETRGVTVHAVCRAGR